MLHYLLNFAVDNSVKIIWICRPYCSTWPKKNYNSDEF